ncbi:MAG: hypothetical protein ACHP7O_10615 [Burkholderiales bacterium]
MKRIHAKLNHMNFSHALSVLLLAGTAIGMSAPARSEAPSSATADNPAPLNTINKNAAKKTKSAVAAIAEDEVNEPDVAGTTVTEYKCELGNKLTVFQNNDDNRHIALKWGKRLHRMARVDTTTGADRFENHHYGLVWIGIPAKGMLLDSKNGHQLANECKNPAQLALKTAEAAKATVALAAPGLK